jgi:hypothetical protein
MEAPYFADLNPDYPSRYAKRWAVFYRYDAGGLQRVGQFTTRKAAERCAERWNDTELDAYGDA